MTLCSVSIVIVDAPQGLRLEKCLAGIASQGVPNLEAVVVARDAAANAPEYAQALSDAFPGVKIRVVPQTDNNAAQARNTGIEAASGQWVLPLNSADTLAKGFLLKALRAAGENPDINMICGMWRTAKGRKTREGRWRSARCGRDRLPSLNDLPHTALIRKSLWSMAGGYDPSCFQLEDLHFWLKCRACGWRPLGLGAPMLLMSGDPADESGLPEALARIRTLLDSLYDIGVIQMSHTTIMAAPEHMADIRQRREEFPLPQLWFWLGLKHEGQGESDAALACYLKAQRLGAEDANRPWAGLQWQIQYRLYCLYTGMGFRKGAAAARAASVALKPELEARLAEQDAIVTLAETARKTSARRILLMGEFFWPSLGGIETFLGHLADFLLQNGYEVHVLTKTLPQRESLVHNGVRIHEFPYYMRLERGVPGGLDDFDALVLHGGFSHVICLSHPDPWSMYLCLLPYPRPKTIFLPILGNYYDFAAQGVLPEVIRTLAGADHLCRIVERAMDAQLLDLAGIPNVFLPHFVPAPPDAGNCNFRELAGIPPGTPFFAHIANFWPVKDHLGLVNAMRNLTGDWRLVFIGSPHDERCLARVRDEIEGDKRFILLGRQNREITQAAVREADALLLSSKSEGCPLVILEAMSAGTPWVATRSCGSVIDQAGGLAVDLRHFPIVLAEIANNPSLREELGRLGKEHWRACFSPGAVLPAFLDLIGNEGKSMPRLHMPGHLREQMDEIHEEVRARTGLAHDVFL